MAIRSILLTACLAILALQPVAAIVGGEEVQDGEFPFQARLSLNGKLLCSGTILGKTTILTAAHCLYGLPRNDISVLVGTNTLSQGGQTIIASGLAYHQSYDPATLVNDIGIVKLSEPIQFNQNVQPISLGHTNPRNGEAVIVSGWGLTSVRGQAPNLLRKLSAEVLDLQRCSERLEAANPIGTGHICTVVPRGQGACFGDNGAALISLSGELKGIVSWGMPCALGFPDVYTNVAFYAGWIKSFLD